MANTPPRQRSKKRKLKKKKHPMLLSWPRAFVRVLVIYNIGALLVLGLFFMLSKELPSFEELQSFDPDLVSRVYSADGVVLKQFYTSRRINIEIEKIPPAMINAAVAIEDDGFYDHWGVSVKGNLRAILFDVLTLSKQQGASTFTQQLARMLYENIGNEKTISRKLKELLTALQLERTYAKEEIAAMFVNMSYMGHSYGVQAAAKFYFNKNADELEPDECALLAGLIKNSVRFSPLYRPESAFHRRNLVLKKMMDLDYLNEEEFILYKNKPLQINREERGSEYAPYFVEDIRRWLRKEDENLDVNLYKDGLKIFTTLDTRIQAIADSAFQNHLQKQQKVLNERLLKNDDILRQIIGGDTTVTIDQLKSMIRGEIPYKNERYRESLVVQGAMVVIEPSTGYIRALIGGRDFEESEFNRATQAQRQPGSVFKPIVYATAIDNGFPVTTKLLNQPVTLYMEDGTRWVPNNYDKSTGGLTSLREGLRRSLNLISARIIQELISPDAVVETAKRMHLSTNIPAVDAIALGAGVVIPMEMVSAYTIFANNGIWIEPINITRIEDKYGNVIQEFIPEREMVMSEETAYITTSLLQSVIDEGTGGSSRWKYHFYKKAAGKTGTTNSFTDAWFVGFTPKLAAGVYVGLDNPAISLGPGQNGSTAALPIWANFMREVYKTMNWPDQDFIRPESVVEVEVCKDSGLLPSKLCQVESEIFTKNTVPVEYCPDHKEIRSETKKDRAIF